ncbi:MAG: DUF3604 domain-containing protein [Alphaproteobacteria bacterium]
MKPTRIHQVLCLASLGLALAAFTAARAADGEAPGDAGTVTRQERIYSPGVGQDFPMQVYWGDTHLHTSYSTDAGMTGTTLGPEQAYRFARGEEVISTTGQKARLRRPLDFLVVSDHAEALGLASFIRSDNPLLLKTPNGKRWYEMTKAGKGFDAVLEWANWPTHKGDPINNPEMARAAWDDEIKAAEKYNSPGAFTAFIGFEWTSMPGGDNVHRVVIFRDGAGRASQVLPFSMYDSENPEDLWKFMGTYEQKTGGRILAIPHNGNLSNGRMFELHKWDGSPLDRAYAETRIKREPLAEVTQIKGTSESHPFLSVDDEFADFELLDQSNILGLAPKQNAMLAGEYAREALKNGLLLEQKLGVNPFKFGMIGSSDDHTALSTTEEDNYFGKFSFLEPKADRSLGPLIKSSVDPELSMQKVDLSASGLVGVWARENTREALFDAMERKEVYGSTGTRLTVRVFAGWDFKPGEVDRSDFAPQGYKRGVPMGGDLANAPAGQSPVLMIRALRDPDGANLDRIQVIKGWLDADGNTRERIYDVAVSDGRTIDADGRCKTPVGSTVDVANATWSTSIGASYLAGYWKDPEFNAAEKAFYYVRVIEIPTPRWTAYDAKFFNVKQPEGTKMQLQDRAYSSPIWYTPPSG